MVERAIASSTLEPTARDDGTTQSSRRIANPLDAKIAERGSNLSLGQQQLLAIGRALLCTPRLLLLDEGTADREQDAAHWAQLLCALFVCT
jgi:ATP-binding cassette, subfamily B, multidrug efflux pump